MKQVSVITGGSGGIGLEIAKCFGQQKAVVIADIDDKALEDAKEALLASGVSEVYTAHCDVTNRENIATLAKLAAGIGSIGRVVHTAGVSGTVSNPNLVMEVDLIGTALMIEGFYPYMEAGSSMVLIASMMGYVIPSNPAYDQLMLDCLAPDFLDKFQFHQGDSNSAYNFAKRGVQLLAEKWAAKFGEKGARINSLSPGIIETPMAVKAAEEHPEQIQYMRSITPLGRNGTPADIALAADFLCSDSAAFVTGSDLRVDGGLIKNLMALKSGQ